MIPADRPAAFAFLLLTAALIWLLIYLAETVNTIVHERPVVTKHPYTGDLQIVRSPNPDHRPRRHGIPQ